VKALKDLADNIPILYSAQVTAALSAIVAFSCAFFYISEEQTRKENLQRIMARLEERRVEVQGANREERRYKERASKREKRAKQTEVSAQDNSMVEEKREKQEGSGFLEEASQLGRAQAIQLNQMLEDKGILPKLSKQQQSGSSSEAQGIGKEETAKGSEKKKKKNRKT